MDVVIRLIDKRSFLLTTFDFHTFGQNEKNVVKQNLRKFAIKIFNIVNILGPKAIMVDCENDELKSFLINSLNEIFLTEFNFTKLGGGVEILSSLPFYSEEPISLRSKVRRLGQFGNKLGIGIDISSEKIRIVCIDGFGNIIRGLEKDINKEEGHKAIIEKLKTTIKEILESIDKQKILSIGIGIPGGLGPLFVRKMIVFDDWEDTNLKEIFEDDIGIPTFVENDANVLALSEKELSRLEGDFFILSIGNNVGGGIIMNEQIVHGENFFAGELGHIILEHSENADLCGCGNKGCLEAIVSRLLKEDNLTQSMNKLSNAISKAIEIIVEITGINQVLIGSRTVNLGYQFIQSIRDSMNKSIHMSKLPIKVYESSLEKFPEAKKRYIGAIGAAIYGFQNVDRIIEKEIVVIKESDEEMGKTAAKIIADQIKRKSDTVLGLATGSTPISMYRELIRLHKEERLDFSSIKTFNLDEYYPMNASHPQSYATFMKEWFFNHVNIKTENTNLLDGSISENEIISHCKQYERNIKESGGIDIQILGIGGSFYNEIGEIVGGHIGFNEAGSNFKSRTRKVTLANKTRTDNARFFETLSEVPYHSITMGIGTILEAKRIILLASGEHKAKIIKYTIESEISNQIPASILQTHPNTTVLIEKKAASDLSRVNYPWLFFDIDWKNEIENTDFHQNMIDKALLWLSNTVKKPLDVLDIQDFHNNFLLGLLEAFHYDVRQLTQRVISRVQSKIIYRQELPKFKNILVFSIRPGDDAVIADIVRALLINKNNVKIINMVSGNINVKDEDVITYCDENNFDDSVKSQILNRTIDHRDLLKLKTLIRKDESIKMHKYLGLSKSDLIFFELPIYETRAILDFEKISQKNIIPITDVLNSMNPEIVLVPEGTTDPHGLKSNIVNIINSALLQSNIKEVIIWQYKTTMIEYTLTEGDIIVPFDEKEMDIKSFAIQNLKSQRVPIFPGFDPRPLWQRIKERNESIGIILKTIGLVSEEFSYATICQKKMYSNPIIS